MKKWCHNELADDLAEHLRGNSDRVVWTDMQLGPSGSPRPDVYTIPKTYSAFKPLAYECKISVADFRRDITSGKWQNYLKFASGVIFAVPAGLIKKEDVPAGCGLIVRHDEIWRTVKGPTLRALSTLPHEAWMKLMIDGLNRQGRQPSPRDANPWHTQQALRKRYGDSIADALSDRDNAEFRLRNQQMIAQQTVDALRAAEQERVAHARRHVEQELAEARRASDSLRKFLGLPEGASMYAMRNAAQEMIDRLEAGGEIKRLRAALGHAQRALTDGLKPMPSPVAEPDDTPLLAPAPATKEDELL